MGGPLLYPMDCAKWNGTSTFEVTCTMVAPIASGLVVQVTTVPDARLACRIAAASVVQSPPAAWVRATASTAASDAVVRRCLASQLAPRSRA
jgi:hypothetical protein